MKKGTKITSLLAILILCGGLLGSYSCPEQAKLLASDGSSGDRFGSSVSISGDYCIIGAYYDDDNGSGSGSAYVFVWEGDSWVEQAKLLPSDGAADDYFGRSVSISGDYCIVGAYEDDDNGDASGSAYIFKRDGENWVEQAKLLASDGAADDHFGQSVSISGDYCIVGAYGDDDNGFNSGSAYIFARDGDSWVEQVKLLASDGQERDYFGRSVSISDSYCIAGAYFDDDNGSYSGSAYIFKRDGENWVEQAKLLASDGQRHDLFGCSVSISSDYCIVGAYWDGDNGSCSGSAYIFVRDGENWVEQTKLLPSDGQAGDYFGGSVSISGDYCMAGAYGDDDNGDASGSAYIFKRDGENWVQQTKLLASDGEEIGCFGGSVSISGDYCIAGASGDNDNGDYSGSAYISHLSNLGPGTPVDLEIVGLPDVGANCPAYAYYTAIAYNDSGCTKDVTESVLWWVEPGNLASIDVNGLLTVHYLKKPRNITIYAQYTEGDIVLQAEMTVKLYLSQSRIFYVRAGYETIQDAVNDANDGDVVIVAPGTYLESGIDFEGKAITVRSTNPCDANIVASTKVGRWSGGCYGGFLDWGTFEFENNEDSNSVLAGFTINNNCYRSISCQSSSPTISNCIVTEGGIRCEGSSSPTISNCIVAEGGIYGGYNCSPTITGCTITGNAGIFLDNYDGGSPEIINCTVSDVSGIICRGGNLTITGCTITGNTSSYGGGISFTGNSLILTDSVIRGNSSPAAGGGVYVNARELIISNCEISDNQATSGGGISLSEMSGSGDGITITGCVITGNSANKGGAIEIFDSQLQNWECSNVKIDNCTISGNSARCGGAFAIYSNWFDPEFPSVVITNCNISGNAAETLGGGFYYADNRMGVSKISNSVITGNSAQEGGGIYCYRSKLATSNCTISGNSANEGGGIYFSFCNYLAVSNCILFGDTASDGAEIMLLDQQNPETYRTISYSDVKGGEEGIYVGPGAELEWGPGNIDADPLFVDSNNGDYHLLPTSPCIDTGDPNYVPEPNETDLDGNPRIVNGRIDMGAYEYVPPVEVEVKLTPQMLNCESHGKWLKAHVIMPEEIYHEDVDVNTPAVADPPGVESEFIEVNEYSDGSFDVQIYFDREIFCQALSETEDNLLEVTVTGFLTDDRKFEGSDTIRLKNKLRQNRHRQNKKLFEGRRK